ncbi:rhodanese-like domain-containing protein [Erythrobacter sp. WG]|uniref:rhodanese-like domain-containing protein n=1 Tax=Erythrobacter sp. WG TaxID=2985510 RepID=UPI00226D98DF|nr:rhodanese-like domain-containing protein [Erythrobacter sp. WG]MCX9145991.1 rhodanese-like domain-containing protein [Erythrobacter sp. WG]
MRLRSALRLAAALPPLLALAACGGESDADRRHAPSAPMGFELAAASTADKAAPVAASVVEVSPEALWAQIEAGKVRVIDVRTREEAVAGVIPEAEHIPLDRFDPAKLDLSDGRKVVLYCRSGRRSEIAAEKLAAFTGQPVEHLAGGMLSWEAAGLPIDKPEQLAD